MQGILVLAAYSAFMLIVTKLFTKRQETAEGFHVGNRRMGAFSSALSIAATWIWAPALFTSAETAYNMGVQGLAWFLVPNIVCLLLFIPYAKRIRRQMPQGITLAGFMGERYRSPRVRRVYLFQLGGLSVLSTGVQLLAGGKILATVTGLPFWFMTVALAAIAYSYSQFSGIQASVMTDAVQMLLILATCALIIPWALSMPNAAGNLLAGLAGADGEQLGIAAGVSIFFGYGLPTAVGLVSGPFGDQCFWQRAFSIRKDRIGRSFGLGAAMFAVVPLSMGILGFIAAGSGFVPQDGGVVNMELVMHLFPAWVMILFLFMLLSGLLSTVDSNLCAAASLTTDIWPRGTIRTSKLAMAGLLLAGIGIANIPGLSVTHLFLFYGTMRSSTLLTTVLTLNGKKLSANGVAAGVVASLCVGLPIFAYGTIFGLPLYKTIGSLTTVLLAATIAICVTRIEGRRHAR